MVALKSIGNLKHGSPKILVVCPTIASYAVLLQLRDVCRSLISILSVHWWWP